MEYPLILATRAGEGEDGDGIVEKLLDDKA